MTQVGTPLVRSAIAAAVGLLLLAEVQPALAVPLVYFAEATSAQRVGEDNNFFEDSKRAGAPVTAEVLGATALSGTGLLTASSSGSLVRTGDNFTINATSSLAKATLSWRGTLLDPIEAGVLGRLSFSASGSTEGTASGQVTLGVTVDYFISAQGQSFSGDGATRILCDPVCTPIGSSPFVPATATFLVKAGAPLELSVFANAAVGFANSSEDPVRGTGAGSVSLSYEFEVFEDRRHWTLPGTGALAAGESWVEQAAPDATSWAVFNSTNGRSLGLSLAGPTTWRGLIADGESVNLDLRSLTLTLGSAGPSQKTYSIRVGEGREATSSLTLRNGTVVADNDVIVGSVGASTSPLATLTLDGGVVLTQRQSLGVASIAVGATGPGALVVRDGSRIFTNVLSLASRAPVAPDTGLLSASLDIAGAGSRVEAIQVSLGARGDATATVREGGFLQTQTLDLAAQRGSKASLTIDGAGSLLRLTGGFVQIGAGGRATLEARNGGAIEGNSSFFTLGSGDPALFSVMRLSGPGTRLTEAGVQVNTGSLFEMRESADWAGAGNLLAVKGGQVTFRDATAKLSSLSIDGKFNGVELVSTGRVDIEQRSVIDAAGADILIGPGGRLTISGTGTRVTGFNELSLRGTLIVNQGSVLEGNSFITSVDSVWQGTGIVKVNERIPMEGQLNPGNSPGLLRIEGSLTMTRTARLVLEMAGTTPGTQYDVLQVTGDLDLQGGQIELRFIDGFAPRTDDRFVLLNVGGSFANSAAVLVSGLLPGWQFDAGFDAATGQLTLQSLSNGVSAVPEASTWMLLLLGLGLLRRLATQPDGLRQQV